jgi:DNA polymerase III subunit epsilon
MNINKKGLLVDVETTGLAPGGDEIIELAFILFSYDGATGEILQVEEQESFLREPLSSRALRNYSSAYRIHGIPFEMVRGQAFHDESVQLFLNKADSVFAHNASFDRSFMYQMYPEVNDLKWYCTMKGVQWKKYGFANSKLATLLSAHNITDHQTHRAMDDITYLMELMKQQNPDGGLFLKEVLDKGPMRKYQPAKKPGKTYSWSAGSSIDPPFN